MRTWLTDRFRISVPVVSAPMAGVAGGQLAGAVSRAGALGMVGVGARSTPDWVAQQCTTAASGQSPWGAGFQAWALEAAPGQLDAALSAGPALVSVSYGDYTPYVDRIKASGAAVVTTIGNLRDARAAVDAGVDAVVARGGEGGGHGRNDIATLPLLQSVLDSIDLPVIAAGGIATSRGLAAVLAAGAAGAWAGTAFLTCREGTCSPSARIRLAAATDTDTVYGRVFDLAARAGWPAEFGERALRNAFFNEWSGREESLAVDEHAAEQMKAALENDDTDTICIDAGQGVALLRTPTTTAAHVVAEYARAGDLLRRFSHE
jgi:nitronate monooxygenase